MDGEAPKDLSKPFNVQCGECKHIWAAAYLPMLLEDMAKILRAASCPLCGNTSNLVIPSKARRA